MFLLWQVEKYIPSDKTNKNALTIHYTRNRGNINDDEMVLVDAGGVGTSWEARLIISFIMGMSLILLALGRRRRNSLNLNGIYIRYHSSLDNDN
jgi:hypothetical protein